MPFIRSLEFVHGFEEAAVVHSVLFSVAAFVAVKWVPIAQVRYILFTG